MAKLHIIFYNHFYKNLDHLSHLDPKQDWILLAESMDECRHVPHHKKKITLWLSALRNYKVFLESKGYQVIYSPIDCKNTKESLCAEAGKWIEKKSIKELTSLLPPDYRLKNNLEDLASRHKLKLSISEDPYHISSIKEFKKWTENRKMLTMEYFYREMRKKTGLLMTADGAPLKDQWNFDKENRSALPKTVSPPKPLKFKASPLVKDVMSLVERIFPHHFGDLDEFWWGTTHKEAEEAFADFLETRLSHFGSYQDAMSDQSPFVFHSLCSIYINLGLLDPLTCCQKVEEAYKNKKIPLNAAEGFIRQIIGWREFIRGIYWLKMPAYKKTNHLEAARKLPDFYWTAETKMNCMHHAIRTTKTEAYAHHIQRLMITGNFALLAGISPEEVNAWYLIVYADAFEWVQLPNTHGMSLFADGGVFGTKPYAASGSYINRMSNYCEGCQYNVKEKTGDKACPFNFLYWNFLNKNQDKLRDNRRMAFAYKNLDRWDDQTLKEIKVKAERFLESF